MIFKHLKSLTIKLVAGANTATILLLWLVGYSDCISPQTHPMLASLGVFFPIALLANLAFLVFWVLFKWRMTALPVVGFLVAYMPLRTYIPYNVKEEPPEGSIKLVSFNVCCFTRGAGQTRDTSDEIYAYLSQSDADIVCLQEANGYTSIHDRLKTLFPHHELSHVGAMKGNTLAVYSRYPILRSEIIPYESTNNGSVAYWLKVGKDTVVVVNNHFESTHLSLDERSQYKEILKGKVGRDTARMESHRMLERLAASAKLRAPQADSVHAFVERMLGRHPVIVCGDFNDNPISYTRRTVAKDLTDCYVSTGRGLGISFNPKGFFVRIDNVMCSKELVPSKCHVDESMEASDHYPIVCWLKKREVP